MKNPGLSRRSFFAASAALSGGALLSAKAVQANTASTAPSVLYGPPVGAAKLNANENPYGPSPAALKAMIEDAVNRERPARPRSTSRSCGACRQ